MARERQAWQRGERSRVAHWMRGVVGISPPEYVLVLEAAEEWGMAPWRVEAECSQYWWERWLIRRGARSDATKR